MTLILGLDPGLRCFGWGVLDVDGHALRLVAFGVIKPSAGKPPPLDGPLSEPAAGQAAGDLRELSLRGAPLLEIACALREIIRLHQPSCAGLEAAFFGLNNKTYAALEMARAVALLTLQEGRVPCFELEPARVKRDLVGSGRANKEQVRSMVERLFPGARSCSHDEADAIAVAVSTVRQLEGGRGLDFRMGSCQVRVR